MTGFAFGASTDIGMVRAVNQDRHFTDGSLFAVADGMGGHSGGEVASGLAVDALTNREPIGDLADLVALVHLANDRIVATSVEDPALRGMGTTISVLAELDDVDGEARLGIANVGDSRVYVLGDDGLEQLTEDHSLVEALVRDGRLSPEEAGRHPQRNILTRALGIDAKVLVDAWELRAVTGDRFLVCSDGLFNELDEEAMAGVVADTADPQDAADRLVELACDAGGRDNVTAVVVHVDDADQLEADQSRVIGVQRAVPDAETFAAETAAADETMGHSVFADGTGANSGVDRSILTWRVLLIAAAIVTVVVLVVTAVAAYARDHYYVGVDDDEVVIFQGRPGGVLWLDPTVEEPVNLAVAELGGPERDSVERGVEFGDIGSARDYGRDLALRVRAGN